MKNCDASTSFHTKLIRQPLQAASKTRILLAEDGQGSRRTIVSLQIVPRTTRDEGVPVHTVSRRLETALPRLPPASNITKQPLRCNENKKEILKFFFEYGHLFRRGFNQAPLQCIAGDKITRVLQEVHGGDCGEHQRVSRLY